MGTAKTITFFFLILTCWVVFISSAAEICFSSACRRTEPLIRFPFRLQNTQPPQCGYPGFDLTCDSKNQTVIEFPFSGKFSVQNIDYGYQEIWVNDPSNCLPQRLLKLNLSGSPFTGVHYQDFTLFNCSFDYRLYRFNPIACLSDSSYTVVATSSIRAARILSASCNLMSTIPVPVQWPYFEQVWSSDLSEDIRLTWAEPQCRRCELRNGRCGLKSNSTSEIECKTQRGSKFSAPPFLNLISK